LSRTPNSAQKCHASTYSRHAYRHLASLRPKFAQQVILVAVPVLAR